MIVLIGKTEFINVINQKLLSYETRPSGKYVQRMFANKDFELKIYTTGTITINGNKEHSAFKWLMSELQEENYFGMDEVGVGDFFGPTVYVGVKLTSTAIEKIVELKLSIRDSKKIKDEEMQTIFEQLKDVVEYQVQIVYDKDLPKNLNSIAQKMHYHYLNIQQVATTEIEEYILDLFTTENNFQKVSSNLNQTWPANLKLETKADDKYVCVALASIFARVIFLQEIQKLEQKYQQIIPLGANVQRDAQNFANKFGKEELATFCKTTFKTFKQLD